MKIRSTLIVALSGILAAGWFALPAPGTAATAMPPAAPERFVLFNPPRPVPDTAFVDPQGRTRTLAEFKGRVVLLNFWATWCAPCIREMPSLSRLQAELGGEDFTVIALSEDFWGWDIINGFLAERKLSNLPVFRDTNMRVGKVFGIPGLPTSILIDRQGREVGRLAGITEWDSADAMGLIRHFMGQPGS